MEIFLMALSITVFGIAAACAAFGAATRTETPPAPAKPATPALNLTPPQFFVDPAPLPAVSRPQAPIEALLLQIESHVRLEQAAAESFVESPTAALLHSKTISPLVQ